VQAKEKEVKNHRLKVYTISVHGFKHYYCMVCQKHFNLYRDKCHHLKEIYPDYVILEFSAKEIKNLFG